MDFLIMIKHVFLYYFRDHIYIALTLGAVFGLLLFRKPKLFLTVFLITLILTGVLYLISTLSITGAYQKQKLLHQEEQFYRDYSSLKNYNCPAYPLMKSC